MKKFFGITVLLAVMIVIATEASAQGFDRWTTEMAAKAKQEASKLKTSDNADWWARANVRKFYGEFFFPGRIGQIDADPYGVPIRNYDSEDLTVILQATENILVTLLTVNARVVKIPGFELHRDNLIRMIQGIQARTTPAHRHKMEVSRELEMKKIPFTPGYSDIPIPTPIK